MVPSYLLAHLLAQNAAQLVDVETIDRRFLRVVRPNTVEGKKHRNIRRKAKIYQRRWQSIMASIFKPCSAMIYLKWYLDTY